MKSQIVFLGLLTAIPSISAFKYQLWGEAMCAGAPDGGGTIRLGDACSQMGVGVAEGVTIEREDSDGANDAVVFYTSSDCNIDTATAQDEGGCVEVNGAGDRYGSFNVISGQPRRKVREVSRTLQRRTTGYETDENGELLKGTNAPAWHEAVANSPYYHGLESMYNGKMWKWHQVAMGKWSGVKPEDWDDNIHIKNDTLFPYDGNTDYYASASADAANSLEARGLCAMTRRCTAAVGTTTANFAYNAVLVYYDQVGQFKADPQGYLWNALNNPLVQTIVVVINSRTMPGHATSTTEDTLTDTQNQLLAMCQSQHDQVATLIALQQASLEQQRQTNELIAAVLSKLTDQQGGIHMAAFEAAQDGQNPNQVGACDNEALPNSRRWD